ncbi:hypothetical protein VTH06DRAFT_6413 [Thermothelomyces fergusii]
MPESDNADVCLIHLKLLFAFQWMKEDVGFTDGLWGLWDSRAGEPDPADIGQQNPRNRQRRATRADGGNDIPAELRAADKRLSILSKIREKRWALPSDVISWTEDMLPPLDILLVWHTHMLNPRAYLEDCMLSGLRQFWATGMPWHLINKAIDNDFNYNVSAECMERWTRSTGLAWENARDPLVKTMMCPRCNSSMHIPWTTCEFPETARFQFGKDLFDAGIGYGDADLQFPCPQCNIIVCKELLAAAKFVKDYRALIGPTCRPMPGTLLDPVTGTPSEPSQPWVPPAHVFPNRLLKSACAPIRIKIATLLISGNSSPSMKDVRDLIENAMKDKKSIQEIEQMPSHSESGLLPPSSRIAVRKMMSRYWENFGQFALDLGAAVMRQGIFVEKMCQLEWLHGPAPRDRMKGLIDKYTTFIKIMVDNPTKIAVPTLDIDLAWHTHQLVPGRYYQYTVGLAGQFIDHDDKIDSITLGEQFEWTSKVYQELTGKVYSECTLAESFHASGSATRHPPSSSPHISAHPAVRPNFDQGTIAAEPQRNLADLNKLREDNFQRRLDTALSKARARAKRRGRKPPEKEDVFYDHWGYPYLYEAPYRYPLWWTPGIYAAWYPGDIAGRLRNDPRVPRHGW